MCISRSPVTTAAAALSYRLALDHPGRLSKLGGARYRADL